MAQRYSPSPASPSSGSGFTNTRWRLLLLMVVVSSVWLLFSSHCDSHISPQALNDSGTSSKPLAEWLADNHATGQATPSAVTEETLLVKKTGRKQKLQRIHELHEVVKVQNLLPFATTPGDSRGEMFSIKRRDDDKDGDQFNYELCSFTNVCATSDSLHLFVQHEAEYNFLSNLFDNCFSKDKYKAPQGLFGPCHCFYPQFKPIMLPFFRQKSDNVASVNATGLSLEEQVLQEAAMKKAKANSNQPSRNKQTSTHPLTEMNKGHYFGIHKYVRHHHIAHWAQKIVLFQSAMQHSHAFPTPQSPHKDYIDYLSYHPATLQLQQSKYMSEHPDGFLSPLVGMVMHDMDLPLSDHEHGILNHSIQAVLSHSNTHVGLSAYLEDKHLREFSRYHDNSNIAFSWELDTARGKAYEYWTADSGRMKRDDAASLLSEIEREKLPKLNVPAPSYMRCYERLTFTRAFGIFSTSAKDTTAFRAAAYKAHGLTTLAHRCPPRRVVLLYRENRGITNWEEIGKVVEEMTGKPMERETIDGNSNSERQISLFASAGILLSSHSSQMVNVMFSHPHSAMIEVTAEFYNADFAEYAHGMGVFFQYAIGGTVPKGISDPGIQQCNDVLSQCEGDSHCMLIQRFRCGQRSFQNKNQDFIANITAVRQAIAHSIEHLNWACGGKW